METLIQPKIIFVGSMPPEKRQALQQELELVKPESLIGEMLKPPPLYGRGELSGLMAVAHEAEPHSLDEGSRASLVTILETAAKKLQIIGFRDPASLLPSPDQIIYAQFRLADSPPFFETCDPLGRVVLIKHRPEMTITDPALRFVAYHGIAHFINRVVVQETNSQTTDGYFIGARGFNRSMGVMTAEGLRYRHLGIYEEPLADLFAWDCLDEAELPMTAPSSYYWEQDSFMVALVEKLADETKVSPIDTYRRLFRANIARDFPMQGELVRVFGSLMVRSLNNIRTLGSRLVADQNDLKGVARLGHFEQEYLERANIPHGGMMVFPGMRVHIRRM